MDFKTIENRLVGLIKERVRYLKHVGTYAGEFGDELRQGALRVPAAYVIYGGSEFEQVDGPSYREVSRFTILAVASNLRGGEQSRQGGTGEERGAYEVVEDVLSALVNDSAEGETERLSPRKVTLFHAKEGVTIYGIDVEAAFDVTYSW